MVENRSDFLSSLILALLSFPALGYLPLSLSFGNLLAIQQCVSPGRFCKRIGTRSTRKRVSFDGHNSSRVRQNMFSSLAFLKMIRGDGLFGFVVAIGLPIMSS